MPTVDKIFNDVQLYIDFTKDITGATKLADSVLYSNLEPDGTSGNSNLAISFAKIYTWAQGVFVFNPSASTGKITINPNAIPDIDTTYAFQEGTKVGAFQYSEDGGAWQDVAIHNALYAGDSTTNPTQAANVKLTKGSVSGDPDDTVELQWYNGSSWAKISSIALGLLENGKIKETYLPSYVDDVIEAYYDNGDFYTDPTTHTSTTKITPESGKIYVDLVSNDSYRWGGTTYVKISNPTDVFTGATSSVAGTAGLVPAPAARRRRARNR